MLNRVLSKGQHPTKILFYKNIETYFNAMAKLNMLQPSLSYFIT